MSCCAGHAAVASAPGWALQAWTNAPYLTLILGAPLVLLIALAYPALWALSPQPLAASSDELEYTTPSSSEAAALPKLKDAASVQLSVVIPAYNERKRLVPMLLDALQLLTSGEPLVARQKWAQAPSVGPTDLRDALREPLRNVEIIIVDDGSSDGTAESVLEWARKKQHSFEVLGEGNVELRVVTLSRNRGKGGAVRHGVLHARGSIILFADADGATRFAGLRDLAAELERVRTPAGHGVVVGSRAHLVGSEQVVKRSFIRNFLMHSFHLFLSLLLRPPSPTRLLSKLTPKGTGKRSSLPVQPETRDTQCGFKLFTRASARSIFPGAHIQRWIFDVELLLRAQMASEASIVRLAPSGGLAAVRQRAAGGEKEAEKKPAADDALLHLPLPIAEVPVVWTEIDGSKIDLLKDSVGMAVDLCVIRANYALGRWARPAPAAWEPVQAT